MPSTQYPAVSVCMPTYRGAQFVGDAIESVLAQTFRDFELIVIDDNSPDDTASVVARYADPRIRFLRNPHNLGPEGNWNRCLELATGRYCKLLPQDDVLASECLAAQVAVLDSDQAGALALVFCARNIVDAQDRVLMVRRYPGGQVGRIAGSELIGRCLRRGTNLVGEPGGVLFRTSVARQIGAFSAAAPYVIDLDYWVRLLLHGDAHYQPEVLVSFRVSTGSWSVAIGKRQSADFHRLMETIAQRPGFKARWGDMLAGKTMAHLNAYLRIILYRLVLARGRR